MIVVIAIIIVISCFNKTKKDSNKAKDTGTATENVTGVTEQVSETEEAKELFAPKESDATAAIGDELESSYAVVIDEQDGTVVAGKNAHEKMYPASMTKVMTVLVAAEQAEKNAIDAAKNENAEIDSPTIIGAQAANELLNIDGIKASFVLTKYNGKIYVSARAIDEVNVQIIMERVGGGGHMNTAGAQFQHTNMEEAIETLKETIYTMKEEGDI